MYSAATQQPSPIGFFKAVNSHQHTAAIKAAVELDVFTAIGEGNTTAAQIAQRCAASERGIRILCDGLCVMGFLTKDGANYGLSDDSAIFLDKRSRAYVGGALEFLLSPTVLEGFSNLTEAVRRGGTAIDESSAVAPEHPMWVRFARGMSPLMSVLAENIAALVDPGADSQLRILDIAAGHGMFGLAFAKRNPQATVVAVDWANVLEVATENANRAGVMERYTTRPGSAFEVEFGTGYDLVLVTNFLHHFDQSGCETILRKVHSALSESGRAITVEFVPNEDRISPPESAFFSLTMLSNTPGGEAYTFSELNRMLANTGFKRTEMHAVPGAVHHLLISYK
jgi:ubiquinone/menaquinone biosynthesis C-methylase UbiE